MPDTIIFSDLDGTLLDAADYSFAAAKSALGAVRARGIPLVLCSSKRRAEIEEYRRRMDNGHLFIVENGGGIFWRSQRGIRMYASICWPCLLKRGTKAINSALLAAPLHSRDERACQGCAGMKFAMCLFPYALFRRRERRQTNRYAKLMLTEEDA